MDSLIPGRYRKFKAVEEGLNARLFRTIQDYEEIGKRWKRPRRCRHRREATVTKTYTCSHLDRQHRIASGVPGGCTWAGKRGPTVGACRGCGVDTMSCSATHAQSAWRNGWVARADDTNLTHGPSEQSGTYRRVTHTSHISCDPLFILTAKSHSVWGNWCDTHHTSFLDFLLALADCCPCCAHLVSICSC